MKIAQYNDMMSYLTRPEFSGGSGKKPTTIEELKKSGKITTLDKIERPEKAKLLEAIRRFEIKHGFRKNNDAGGPQIVEPSKSMQVDTTTKGLPDPLEEFKKQADMFLQASFASTNKDYFNSLIEQEYNKALEAGVQPQEAISFLRERSQMYRTLADEGRMQGEPAILGPSYGRDNKAIGGGVIEGEDLGTREGFSIPRLGIVKKPLDPSAVKNWHKKYEGQPYFRYKGDVIPEGAVRVKSDRIVFTGDVKTALENRKNFIDRFISKEDFIKLRNQNSNLTNQEFYDQFMKDKINDQGKLYTFKSTRDATNKYTDVLEKLPVDYKPRLEAIKEYIDKFNKKNKVNPSAQEIIENFSGDERFFVSNRHVKAAEDLYKIKLPEGYKGSARVKLEQDLKKLLSRKTIIDTLDAGKFPTESQIQSVLKSTRTIAATRQVDLANYLAGTEVPVRQSGLVVPKKYKKLATNAITDLELYKEGQYGPRKKRTRAYNEKRFSKIFGIDEGLANLRKDILGKIFNFIPELKGLLAVDEIGGLTAGARTDSPYTIFGQVLGRTFNDSIKGNSLDVDKSFLERKLIKLAKNDPERLVELEKYNKKVDDFELMANKNNPTKKVKGMRLTFEPPSKAIKNKKVYNQFKDLFDEHYEKYGYSFEVDKDTDSLIDISKKLDNKSFQNTVKNRFKNLIGKGGKVGIISGLATLAATPFALAGTTKEKEEDKSLIEEYPLLTGAAAAATPLATKTGRKIYGALAKPLLKAFGSVPAATYFAGKELSKEDPNYAIAGADLLLPELGKRVAGSGTGIMSNIGRFLTNPIGRLARGFTPAGIALQGVELVNQAMKEQKRINEMRENDPEAYQQFIAEQEDMMGVSAASGGLIRKGFADGPEDPSKRKFMKIMGGLASLPIIGRFFDVAKEAAPVLDAVKTEVVKGKPEWFDLLVNKVIRIGENVTERFATKEREIVHKADMGENETVYVYQELDTGTVRVEYENPDNMGGDSVNLVYKKELPDEGNPNPSPDFYVTELEPRGVRTGPDDYDIEFDGENYGNSVDELMSDTGRLEYFATGKTDMKKIEKSNEKRKKVKAMNESTMEQAEYLEEKYGPGDDLYYQDYSDYD